MMSEIQFEYNGSIKKLRLKRINVFLGASQTGKTQLLEYFHEVFQGQHKNAVYERQEIVRGQFYVKAISSSYTIDEELKMSSKTEVLNICKQAIAELSDYQINEIEVGLKSTLLPLETAIKKYIIFEEESGFAFNNLLDIIKQYYSFVDAKRLSPSLKRFFLYMNLFSNLEKDKKIILLIDDFENHFDIVQMLRLVDSFTKNSNLTVLIFTKSVELCKSLYNKYPISIVNRNLESVHDVLEGFINNEINYSRKQLAFLLVTEDEIKNNVTNLLRVYFLEFIQLIISNDREYVMNNFKKMGVFEKSDIEILGNFEKFLASKFS